MYRFFSTQLRQVGLFAIFVLPFATLFYLLSSEINDNMDIAKKEQIGITYIIPLRHLLEDLTDYRSAVQLAATDQRVPNYAARFKAARDKVRSSVEEVDEVDQKLGGKAELDTTKTWIGVQANWLKLQERTPDADPQGLVQEIDPFIDQTRQMIRLVGDASTLILDPQLDSYYFMDGVVMRLPKLTDDTARARDLGLRLEASHNVSREDRRELIGLVRIVRDSLTELSRGMQVAYDSNPGVKSDLAAEAQAASSTNEFMGLLSAAAGTDTDNDPATFSSARLDVQRGRLASASDRALKQQWIVYDRMSSRLDYLLDARYHHLLHRRDFVVMFSLIVLLVTTYVFYQFARSSRVAVEAEQDLRRAESKYRAIFEHAIEGIFQTSPDGKYLSANPALARIYGYETVDALMDSVGNIGRQLYVDPARRKEFLRQIQDLGEVTDFESQVYRRDGAMIWINEKAHVVRDDEGRPLLFEGTVEDISERKRFQEELVAARDSAEDANRTKSQFLANMSHELRTPLNAIIGYSEMLQEEAEDLEQNSFIPDLQKIYTAGKHLLSLINDVLDLSKIEAGKMELFLEEFKVEDMVREVCATIAPVVEKNHNDLKVVVAENVGVMRADLTKIRQNLFNLLSNASKFTESGQVSLDVSREPVSGRDYIVFTVKDTGIGMTQNQLDRLFQAFSQADASTTRKYGGTGLGLAITRKFCEMMGGSVEAFSTSGHGSSFVCRIPAQVINPDEIAARAVAQPESVSVTPATTSRAHGRGIVLVVDDDPTIHDMMRRLLVREGFEVVTASSGAEGLELARNLHPNVITLDVMMPGMDGWAVLSALKADPQLADIPVIMVTMLEDKSMGFALGATDYMTKPFDRERLATVLRRYAHPSGYSKGRVLIVEDDNATREMLRRMLEKEHWSVEEAANGRLGIERLQAMGDAVPRLILLDLMMPEMDGFAFVETLHEHDNWRTIPVVVVTAKDISAAERQRLNGSVQQILQKGAYSRDELLQQVRRLVAARVD